MFPILNKDMTLDDASLSGAEVNQNHEDGWIVPKWEFPQELIYEMRIEYNVLIKRNSNIAFDILMAPHQTKGGSMRVVGSEKWLEFATHPAVTTIARRLIGNDIILWGTTIFGKPPQSGKETPWHQDGDYYPIIPLEVLTVWIPLDDVTAENDLMKFIPGSHKPRKIFGHNWQEGKNKTINMVCDAKYFEENDAESLIIREGQVSFHDVSMIYVSQANKTNRRRAAFVIRLMPASSFYYHELGVDIGKKHSLQGYVERPLYLVSRTDKTGNNFEIGHFS